eukprot:CAMPEP_0170502462 /NCGR_PEP_ID=MMETSP0208-20121228/41575_1 /TAXON_ID=197538 /ORGANISM="Strombidium inclinatum, Strain S3" /LENGTH=68 /DNA_ID=CAMNT_0010781557 /DNA_START=1287 /DNA_END=1493 /DNA_ORIENTATION=-
MLAVSKSLKKKSENAAKVVENLSRIEAWSRMDAKGMTIQRFVAAVRQLDSLESLQPKPAENQEQFLKE